MMKSYISEMSHSDTHFRNGSYTSYMIQTMNVIIIYRVSSKQITIFSFKTSFIGKTSRIEMYNKF